MSEEDGDIDENDGDEGDSDDVMREVGVKIMKAAVECDSHTKEQTFIHSSLLSQQPVHFLI